MRRGRFPAHEPLPATIDSIRSVRTVLAGASLNSLFLTLDADVIRILAAMRAGIARDHPAPAHRAVEQRTEQRFLGNAPARLFSAPETGD